MRLADRAARLERLERALQNIEPLDPAVIEILQRKTPAERLQLSIRATAGMRLLIAIAIRREHPDWDEPAVQREVARRWLLLQDD